MHRADIESRIGDALARLPLLSAPETLLPRVAAAVHAWMRRPWYQRAWFTWPPALRAVGVVLLTLVLISAFSLVPGLNASVRAGLAELAARLSGAVPDGLLRFTVATSALLAAWRAVAELLLGYAAVVVFVLALMSAMCVAALNRVTLREPMHP